MKALANKVTGNSLTSDALRRLLRDNLAVVSFLIIVFYVTLAVLVKLNLLVPDWQMEIGPSRASPTPEQGWRYLFGLDIFGRSVLSKAIQGAYTAMYVGLMSTLIATPIGALLGAIAGYFGGWIDDLITWLYTTISNIPQFLLLVAFAVALGKGINGVVIALGLTTWVSLARLIRGEFMKHKSREYVQAAAALGGGHTRRMLVHILPNTLHIVIINFSTSFVIAIKSEVILTYLGLGAQAGSASWGLMIDDAKGELVQGVWWGLLAATIFMFFICLAFSIFSDALRDAFDPKLRT